MSSSQLYSQLESLFEDIQSYEGLEIPLAEYSPSDWSFHINAQGYILDCNSDFEALLGYPAGAFTGRHLSTFTLETESAADLARRLHLDGGSFEIKLSFLTQTGDVAEGLAVFSPGGQDASWNALFHLRDTEFADYKKEQPNGNGSHPDQDAGLGIDESQLQPPGADTPFFQSDDQSKPVEKILAHGRPGETPDRHPERDRGKNGRTKPVDIEIEQTDVRTRVDGTGPLNTASLIASGIPATDETPAVLKIPIIQRDQEEIVLEIVDQTTYREWSHDERRLVEEVASQLSLAIENAQLFSKTQDALNETETQAERLALLNAMSERLIRADDLNEVYSITSQMTGKIIHAEQISLALLNSDGNEYSLKPLAGGELQSSLETYQHLKGTSIEVAVREKKLVYNPDNRTGELGNSRSLMVAPLISSSGVIGTLNVGSPVMNAFRPREETLLLQIASVLASTIQGRRLFEKTEEALAETEALYKTSAELNVAQSYDDILTSLRLHTILGRGTAAVSLILFDTPWTGLGIPEGYTPIATWTRSIQQEIDERNPLREWEHATRILRNDSPSIIENVKHYIDNDPGLGRAFPLLKEAGAALFVPLNVGRQWIGQILAVYQDPTKFPEVEIKRLMSVASQAAVALQNIRLLEETRERARQLQTAAEIARDASETLEVDELLNRAVRLLADRFGFSNVSVYLIDNTGNQATIRASTGNTWESMKSGVHRVDVGSESVIGYVTSRGPLVINDTEEHQYYKDTPPPPGVRSQLALPLKAGEKVLGALDVQSTEVNPFRQDVVAVLQTLTDQIAVAVQNALSYELAQAAFEEARQRLEELSMLYNVSQSFASAPLEIEEIASIIAREFLKVLRIPECSVSLIDPEDDSLVTIVDIQVDEDGEHMDLTDVGRRIPVQSYPLAAQSMTEMKPLPILIDPERSEIPMGTAPLRLEESRLVIVPLAAKGQPIGIVELRSTGSEKLATTSELNLAMTLANQAAVTLENARLYEAQRNTAEQLREVDTLKSQFLANMSHELRTPLNSIIGFSRVILKGIDGPVTKLQEQDLSAIYNAGQHLLGLINNILDLSKIEAGKMELNIEEVDLTEQIDNVMFTIAGLIKNKPIQIHRHIDTNLPPILADPLRIRQILLNLLSNSAKFTEEGSISISARIEDGEKTRSQVTISVRDTGPGIAPSDLDKLFQPFSQVDASPTRKTGGTGLGLSISKHLIEMHGSRIKVESVLGEGSRFFFSLPIPDDNSLEFQSNVTESEWGNDSMVIAIDADSRVLSLYERYLEPLGYQVIPFTDPENALEAIRQTQPGAITLDVTVGNGKGWTLLEDLKTDPQTRNIPTVVCSIVDEQQKAAGLGADEYLVKPILETDLTHVLKTLAPIEIQAEPAGNEELPPLILIIEPDNADVRVLKLLLEENDRFRVNSAQNGKQGFEAIFVDTPAAIIMNYTLPDMDGITFLRTIRAYPGVDRIPVFLLVENEIDPKEMGFLKQASMAIYPKRQLRKTELLTGLDKSIRESA